MRNKPDNTKVMSVGRIRDVAHCHLDFKLLNIKNLFPNSFVRELVSEDDGLMNDLGIMINLKSLHC